MIQELRSVDLDVSKDDYSLAQRGMLDLVKLREKNKSFFDDEKSVSLYVFKDPYLNKDHVVDREALQREQTRESNTAS